MISDLIMREASRNSVSTAHSHVGTVDSYDAQNHAVKVKFETDLDDDGKPRVSGWIPIRSQSGGAGSSLVIGPTPGDQAVVSYLEGDPESGHVSGFLHNDVDKPPVVQSGEAHLKTKAATVHINASGDVTVTTSGSHTINAPGVSMIISSSGVAIYGGLVTHNGHDIGKTHQHTDVTPGGALTGAPQ